MRCDNFHLKCHRFKAVDLINNTVNLIRSTAKTKGLKVESEIWLQGETINGD